VVEGNFKWFARVKCLRTLVDRLSKELDFKPSKRRLGAA
jgi:polyphosphate kinase 2 (PPK2 family)